MDIALDLTAASRGTASDGDLLLGPTGDLALVDGGPEIGQLIVMRLRWFLGEWFLDTTKGVPWLTQILGQRALNSDGEAALQNTILTTPGVIALLDWKASLDAKTRALQIAFRAQVTAGIVDYQGSIGAGVTGG